MRIRACGEVTSSILGFVFVDDLHARRFGADGLGRGRDFLTTALAGMSVEGDAVMMVSSRSSSSVTRLGMASTLVPKSRLPPGGLTERDSSGGGRSTPAAVGDGRLDAVTRRAGDDPGK